MKVVFLDIDGVLVTGGKDGTVSQHVEVEGHRFNPFYAPAVKALNRVIEETGAEIVISSSWRCDGPRGDALLFHFTGQGVCRRPIDNTPDLPTLSQGGVFKAPQRGDEIRKWLNENDVDAFVVFDDNRDMDAVKHNFVWIENGMFEGGLTEAHADRAIAILKGVIR